MADKEFFEECRGWNVNEVVFTESNWKTFGGMMRDDFTLFDSYEYTPPPAFLPKGEFPFPIKAKYLTDDMRCKKHHLQLWQAFTSEKLTFEATELAGNHLFFYGAFRSGLDPSTSGRPLLLPLPLHPPLLLHLIKCCLCCCCCRCCCRCRYLCRCHCRRPGGAYLACADFPARAKWMESIIAGLPAGFGSSVEVS